MTEAELRALWTERKDMFMKFFHEDHVKPLTHAKLQQAFVDDNNKVIFRFPKDVALPIERFGQMREYLRLMTKQLSADEDVLLDDEIEKHLIAGLANRPNVVAIGAIMQERKKRRGMLMHTELLYNFITVQLVREDEHPEHFDPDVHRDKIITFKRMNQSKGTTYFFFQQTELKMLSDLSKLSKEEWELYWEESLISQQALPEWLKDIASSIT